MILNAEVASPRRPAIVALSCSKPACARLVSTHSCLSPAGHDWKACNMLRGLFRWDITRGKLKERVDSRPRVWLFLRTSIFMNGAGSAARILIRLAFQKYTH